MIDLFPSFRLSSRMSLDSVDWIDKTVNSPFQLKNLNRISDTLLNWVFKLNFVWLRMSWLTEINVFLLTFSLGWIISWAIGVVGFELLEIQTIIGVIIHVKWWLKVNMSSNSHINKRWTRSRHKPSFRDLDNLVRHIWLYTCWY